jgi:D-3-phosphoglycerate dehydrogenase
MVVDLDAVADALRSGHLYGAAVDVFPEEPAGGNDPFITPLQGLKNVILTPHIGGSTAEAQERIGVEVARKLAEYSDVGSSLGAVNFPQAQLPIRPAGTRYLHIHQNVPGLLARTVEVFSTRNANITGQYLQTQGEIGYSVIDAEGGFDTDEVLEALRSIPGTIRARLLFERQ